jgi:hypothetical protein
MTAAALWNVCVCSPPLGGDPYAESGVLGSREIAAPPLKMRMSRSREERTQLKTQLAGKDILQPRGLRGEFVPSIVRIYRRIVIAANAEALSTKGNLEEGGRGGRAREALTQVTTKALGMNVGGKNRRSRAYDLSPSQSISASGLAIWMKSASDWGIAPFDGSALTSHRRPGGRANDVGAEIANNSGIWSSGQGAMYRAFAYQALLEGMNPSTQQGPFPAGGAHCDFRGV